MATEAKKLHFKAVRMLTASTLLWAVSFPLVKALSLLQLRLLPESSSWFQTSLVATLRFGAGAFVIALFTLRTLPRITRLEIWEGLGLGFFAAGGILLQMDGLTRTTASISAFLTQTFCIWVAVIVAVRDKRLPPLRVILATCAVLVGVAILNNLSFNNLTLGWGEWETLLGAVFFGAQIVWLERPIFSQNNPYHFTFVMFFTMTIIPLPILFATWNAPADVWLAASNPPLLVLVGALVLFCTLGAFVLMNKWQPFVPATEAAVIYGAEPVLASLFALFLPAWISVYAAIQYENEALTWQLIAGGGLIVLANIYLQANWVSKPSPVPPNPSQLRSGELD